MKQWTLKDPKPMGDRDPKYGQTWWSYTHDGDMPLMFNLMEGEVGDGSVVSAEEWVNKESAKGTEYMRLRKVKIQGSAKPVTKDDDKLLQLTYENTVEILKFLKPPGSLKETWDKTVAKEEDTVVEDIGDEPMNLDGIPF